MRLLPAAAALARKHRNKFVVPLVIALGVGAALSFSVPVHRGITKDTLAAITVQVGGKPKTFSKRALEQIQDANEDVDDFFSAAFLHPERHFTNERFADSSTRIRDLKAQIVKGLKAEPPRGDEARSLLGQALHTLQDFYAHSNWVELGRRNINTALGRSVMTDPAVTFQPCPTHHSTLGPNGGGGLTSGYYVMIGGCAPIPAGKCYHGNYTPFCVGINKDKPSFPNHGAARTVAEAATKDFVEQILAEIAGDEKAVRALLDLKGTLGFIIDDTGSMGEEIDGVKNTISRIVNAVRGDPDNQPDNYLLVRFGDPGVGSPLVTDSADALLSAVNALTPGGGGDCPELSQNGLLGAIESANLNSRLYLFTDATAKDSPLRNEVISRAQKKSTRLSYGLTGSCSPVDEAYIRGAAETGGQLFLINQFEVPRLFDLIEPQLSGDLVTILSARGTMAGAPREFVVPVDSTVKRLVVSVSIDTSTSVSLRRPSGPVVTDADPDAQITNIASGRILTVEAPATGQWRVEINGAGAFSVVAEGNSPLEFYRFDFVKPSGDLHGGFAPLPGQPLAGAEGTGEAALLGSFANAAFRLVGEGGETIRAVSLRQNFPDAPADHFVGKFVLPSVPFRVVATGNDPNGVPYQRTFPNVYRAQKVGVELNNVTADVVRAGRVATFGFNVRNLGAAATFDVNVVTSLGSITSLDPTLLSLGAGATGTVRFSLLVPAGTPAGETLTLTMTAARTDDSTVFNSAILNLSVVEAPALQFSAAKYSVTEDVTSTTVSVIRSGDTSEAASVTYTARSVSASERSDFTTASGRLRFAPGEIQKSFPVLITEDSHVEGVETATLALTSPSGASLGPQSTATLEIRDDASEPGANPIDTAAVFVGQHYHDFLNRQADPAGLAFWSKEMTNCGANRACVEDKSINVSAAFFFSIEFQNTSYLIHRLHVASYPNSLPRYQQLLADLRELSDGVIVGSAGWDQKLEQNKLAFVTAWVQRPEFVARHPNGRTAQQFVDALFANAGVTPTSAERAAALNAFGAGGVQGRARALRSVAESGSVYNRQYNSAFVLTQYFGYLRRNPNDPPDNSLAGYQFWLDKMNSFSVPGEDVRDQNVALRRVRRAEMIKAFIVSLEYRARFGRP